MVQHAPKWSLEGIQPLKWASCTPSTTSFTISKTSRLFEDSIVSLHVIQNPVPTSPHRIPLTVIPFRCFVSNAVYVVARHLICRVTGIHLASISHSKAQHCFRTRGHRQRSRESPAIQPYGAPDVLLAVSIARHYGSFVSCPGHLCWDHTSLGQMCQY